MADSVLTKQTTLAGEEVVTRAIQFFSTENWRATTQSSRNATFAGRPPIPWLLLLLTIVGYLCCVVPGVIMYIAFVRKMRRLQNLVVVVTAASDGTEVTVTYPGSAKKLVERFLAALPALPSP